MKRKFKIGQFGGLLLLLLLASQVVWGQSLEVMVGENLIFADVQWFKPLQDNSSSRWSVFSRTRATVSYDNQTDVFTGAYLNYTTKRGIGLSAVGKIGKTAAGADFGVHFFKAKPNFMFFGLASVGVKSDFEYSWFSIFRYTPSLSENWKLYTSLELFTLFATQNHLASVQRLRLGVDYKKWQFGFGGDFTERGSDWTTERNFGFFLRKSF